jgi:ABC-2 type transport system ATP-binding protein
VRSFFKRKYKDVKAVQQVDFKIEQGEIVGFLGPNGAGKTTTLKMLSGLLHPSSGKAAVLGYTPWELKHDYLRVMTLVMPAQPPLVGYPGCRFVPAQSGYLPHPG